MKKIIPYGRQEILEEDIVSVTNVLKSDYLTQGPHIEKFENKFSKYVGSKYSVAVSNGTAALHLNCIALGVSEGDKVITTPITFAASANCVRYCGGEVVFADIDPKTYLLDFDKVKLLLESSPKGTYKGIITVDFAGRAIDLESYKKLADEYGLWIIQDSCHSPGGYFIDSKNKVQKCGNGNFADLSIFSFHPVKHIATGEGGMITTNNKSLYEKLKLLRTHGITKNKNNFTNSVDLSGGVNDYPNWYMEMQYLGYNYRLTDFQSALGISQLKRAEKGLEKRKEIAEKYFLSFKNKNFIKGQSGLVKGHAYHLYVIEVENRLNLYNYLREKSIYTQIHYFPCHMMPYYINRAGSVKENFPCSEKYYSRCISLPIFPSLTNSDLNYVIDSINDFYK